MWLIYLFGGNLVVRYFWWFVCFEFDKIVLDLRFGKYKMDVLLKSEFVWGNVFGN